MKFRKIILILTAIPLNPVALKVSFPSGNDEAFEEKGGSAGNSEIPSMEHVGTGAFARPASRASAAGNAKGSSHVPYLACDLTAQ